MSSGEILCLFGVCNLSGRYELSRRSYLWSTTDTFKYKISLEFEQVVTKGKIFDTFLKYISWSNKTLPTHRVCIMLITVGCWSMVS